MYSSPPSGLARSLLRLSWLLLLIVLPAAPAHAQEAPYFVTYDHHLEEPGNLEIETSATAGIPRSGQQLFVAPYAEIEYGVTGRWTSELYIESQATSGDSAVFTGWRLENRFRPLKREYGINPVLYLEYENVNEASRISKEIEGHTEISSARNSELSRTPAKELEGKLILSSDVHDWNLAGNFLATKNFSTSEGFEFGYALAVARPLARVVSGKQCRLCRENFVAGLEMYGGLGSTLDLSLHNTAHYIAPAIGWQISDNSSIRFSGGVGLTHVSNPVLLRFGYSYEIRGFGRKLAQMFGGRE